MKSEVLDVLIVGAGAAGMMCAAEAGKRGRSVLVMHIDDIDCSTNVLAGEGFPILTQTDLSR